jgi:hypothetical protein
MFNGSIHWSVDHQNGDDATGTVPPTPGNHPPIGHTSRWVA